MQQSKLESLIEVNVNIATGMVVAFLVNFFIVIPLWDLDWSATDNAAVTAIFTLSAVIRGYLWRRFFNAGLHRVIHKWLSRQ